MPVNRHTIAEQRRLRVQIDTTVDAATQDITLAWARAWNEIAGEWSRAIADLIETSGAGEWPTQAQTIRARRAQRALAVTAEALDQLSRNAGVRIISDVSALADAAELWVARVAATQLPPGMLVTFSRVDPGAMAAIVKRSTEQITARHYPLSRQATNAMRNSLIRGVAIGDNPNAAAATMLRRARDGFNGGLWRARVIARTELLDAARNAAVAARRANTDVLNAWRWQCELSRRTCPACLAKHGTVYPATDPGPLGHQACRCTALPITKSWKELGIDAPEPPPIPFEDGEDWLARQPEQVQRDILGKRGYDKWKSGDWPKTDWARLRHADGWRDSWAVAPAPA